MKIRIKQLESRIKLFKKTVFLALFFILYSLFFSSSTFAQSPVPIGEKFGFGDIKSLGEATSKLVVPAFEVTAAAVIIYFLIGAFFYLKSGGNKEEIERARNMINHAIIGFFILMLAFLIIQFLLSSLFGFTGLTLF